MPVLKVWKRIWLAYAALLLISCGGSSLQAAAADPQGDVYGAKRMQASNGGLVEIDNDVGGDIVVVVYPAPEVGLDYIATNKGNIIEDVAIDEAHRNIAADISQIPSGVRIHARTTGLGSSALEQNTAELHVRVPTTSRIAITSLKGNVTVLGNVASVNVHTGAGDVIVRGATGSMVLKTDNGNIFADERSESAASHDLRATGGNITLFALQSNVSLVTTDGAVRFIGTLSGDNNIFTTSGGGSIDIALPDNATYGFQAHGGSRVVNDFLRGERVCGLIAASVPFDFHSRTTGDDYLGRVDVGNTTQVPLTLTSVIGSMTQEFYFFQTNRDDVMIALPPNQGTEPIVTHSITDCGNINHNPNVSVNLEAHAEKGRINIHRIRMQNQ